jgi:photosystem II stability/assembly factor-like uncharacterized protein
LQTLTVAPNGNVYAIVGSALYGSTDNGESWDTLDVSGVSFHTVAVTANGTIFTSPGYALGVRRSTDGGATWTRMELPLTEVDVYAIYAAGADTIYAGGDGWNTTSLMRSTDNGETWTKQSDGLVGIAVYALAQKEDGSLFVGTWGSDSSHPTVYRSTDFGSTWKPVELTTARVTSLATNTRGDLFAGMHTNIPGGWKVAQSGVYRSTDNGETWSGMNFGLLDTNVTAVAIAHDGRAFVGTDNGLYRSVASTLGVDNAGIETDEVKVECAPNPFSSNATIRFTLPAQCHARLVIINTLGREIAVPIDKTLEAGQHAVVFDSEEIPAGRYFIRLTVGGSTITRSAIHIR